MRRRDSGTRSEAVMSETERCVCPAIQSHGFLGKDQLQAEQRTWAVIWLCAAMMLAEIVGGVLFGSIALVADGLHMSTHAGALLLAALAYRYARRHVDDPRFAFGTGKLGDLAAFTSAVILADRLGGSEQAADAGADPFCRGDPDRGAGAGGEHRLGLAAERRRASPPRPRA
jgi:hypothetical protein